MTHLAYDVRTEEGVCLNAHQFHPMVKGLRPGLLRTANVKYKLGIPTSRLATKISINLVTHGTLLQLMSSNHNKSKPKVESTVYGKVSKSFVYMQMTSSHLFSRS